MMKYTLALLAATVMGEEFEHETIDGMQVIGEQEVVTTYTVVEHVDVLAP